MVTPTCQGGGPPARKAVWVRISKTRRSSLWEPEREAFGHRLAELGMVRQLLAAEIDLAAAWGLIWQAAWMLDCGEQAAQETSIAKTFVAGAVGRVVDTVCAAIEPLLPVHPETHPLGCHRPRIPDRDCFEVMLVHLVTGSSWEDCERLCGNKVSNTTTRARHDEWEKAPLPGSPWVISPNGCSLVGR